MMSSMETGAEAGMWTYQRYRTWMESKRTWHTPGDKAEEPIAEEMPALEESKSALPPMTRAPAPTAAPSTKASVAPSTASSNKGGALEIVPEEGGLEAIISKLKNKP